MKITAKHFTDEKSAMRFQNKLYSKYERVRLLSSPLFFAGLYRWEVSNG